MLIGPYLPDGLRLELTSTLVSRPYVEMTAAVMAAFGIEGVDVGRTHVHVAPHRLRDHSLRRRARRVVGQLPAGGGRRSLRACRDRRARRRGRCRATPASPISWARWGARSSGAPTPPSSVVPPERTCAASTSTWPTCRISCRPSAAVAMFADTPTRISGVGFIRGKESDRLGDLARELGALGGARRGDRRRARRASLARTRCTAPRWRPTTTTAWRWRSVSSARWSPGSRSPIPTSSPRAGPASGRCSTSSGDDSVRPSPPSTSTAR